MTRVTAGARPASSIAGVWGRGEPSSGSRRMDRTSRPIAMHRARRSPRSDGTANSPTTIVCVGTDVTFIAENAPRARSDSLPLTRTSYRVGTTAHLPASRTPRRGWIFFADNAMSASPDEDESPRQPAVTAARGGYAVPSAADSAPTCSSDHAWPRGSPITAGQRQVRPSGSPQHSAAALGVVQAPAAHAVGEGPHPADALGDPDACNEVADGGVQPFRPPRGRARRSWSVLRGRRRAAPRARRRAALPRPRPWSTGRCTHATPTDLTTSTNLSGARWGGWPVWHNRSHTFSRRATFSRAGNAAPAHATATSRPRRGTGAPDYAQTASRICGGQAGTASRSASSRTRRAGSPGTARTSTVTGSGPWHGHANEACAASNGNPDSDRGRNQGRDGTPSAGSVDVVLADRTSATMLVDGQVGVLAARVLRGGGVLAVPHWGAQAQPSLRGPARPRQFGEVRRRDRRVQRPQRPRPQPGNVHGTARAVARLSGRRWHCGMARRSATIGPEHAPIGGITCVGWRPWPALRPRWVASRIWDEEQAHEYG